MCGGQHIGQDILGVVGILILIHHDESKAVLIFVKDSGVLAKQQDRLEQQVVKVHGI